MKGLLGVWAPLKSLGIEFCYRIVNCNRCCFKHDWIPDIRLLKSDGRRTTGVWAPVEFSLSVTLRYVCIYIYKSENLCLRAVALVYDYGALY